MSKKHKIEALGLSLSEATAAFERQCERTDALRQKLKEAEAAHDHLLGLLKKATSGTAKRERRQQDLINRVKNLYPGRQRLWRLDKIADELLIEADLRDEHDRPHEEVDSLIDDGMFLSRLAWDLHELRDVLRGENRQNIAWPRGPRP